MYWTWPRVSVSSHGPRVPREWIEEQARLARLPGFLETRLRALRSQVELGGQCEVLLDWLPQLEMPMLVVWGALDRVFPVSRAPNVATRLRDGSLEISPMAATCPRSSAWSCSSPLRAGSSTSGHTADGQRSHVQPSPVPSPVPYDLPRRRANSPRAAAAAVPTFVSDLLH